VEQCLEAGAVAFLAQQRVDVAGGGRHGYLAAAASCAGDSRGNSGCERRSGAAICARLTDCSALRTVWLISRQLVRTPQCDSMAQPPLCWAHSVSAIGPSIAAITS